MPKPRKVRVWVYLVASLVLALAFLELELRVLSLFVNPSHFNSTLYDMVFYPAWGLNAFPAGYVLGLLGLRVYRRASQRATGESAQEKNADVPTNIQNTTEAELSVAR
jgi:hypothetical protein